MTHGKIFARLGLLGALAAATLSCGRAGRIPGLIVSNQASDLESFAARELRRYIYLRTGRAPRVDARASLDDLKGDAILVAVKGDPLLAAEAEEPLGWRIAELGAQEYILRTEAREKGRLLVIVGGDPVGALYGAYRTAEALGFRFDLDGDTPPEDKAAFALPDLDETGRPLFDVRGILPFHDFPEGPDWWSIDHYKAVLAQLPKLRLNFFGLHTYPDKGPNAEPAVWIGLERDYRDDGKVTFSYPASWQNTRRGNWGYEPRDTAAFHCGADLLFDRDDFGNETMKGLAPQPADPRECDEIFNRAARLLRNAFTFARRLGVRTCVGTETFLTVPETVKERLARMDMDHRTPAVIRELYRGIFDRIGRAYPIDYYWFWTPEGWTWDDATPAQVRATAGDLALAVQAHRDVGASFSLATCGWVLGPPSDRTLFDRVLPKSMAVSTINREVGKAPLDPGFARISGRSKWAIPWLEDDPALTAPQLWAGRMRRDAADALRYGCDGLLGIHWRTRILSPNVTALAAAAWDQSWADQDDDDPAAEIGPASGQPVSFGGREIAGAGAEPEAAVYQTVRDRVFGYVLPLPNGTYSVTLKFVEGQIERRRGRVFDVLLQGRRVAENLDIFARAGRFKALDLAFRGVAVTDGRLAVEFADRIHYPAIAGIAVEGPAGVKKINCGGPAVGDFEADWPETPRHLRASDLYLDWASSRFGAAAGAQIAPIFARLDGRLPVPVTWTNGPGGIVPNPEPWENVRAAYGFVDELAACAPLVKEPGHRDSFEYWLRHFEYLREVARFTCLWAGFDRAMAAARAGADAPAKAEIARREALPVRIEMAGALRRIYACLLGTVSNMGELGTIANWEQHLLPGAWERPGAELAALLGESLPPEAELPAGYDGPTRIVVPARRTSLEMHEELRLEVLILSRSQPDAAEFYWRELGQGKFRAVPLQKVRGGVYSVMCPVTDKDVEWYIRVRTGREVVHFPATAPAVNQTVVVLRGGEPSS